MSVLTDEQRLVQEMARTFAREVLAPGAAARAKAKAIEPAVLAQMGELGFFGMTVPEEMGGVGADYMSYALALIEIAAGDGAVSTVMSVHNAPFNAILQRFASPAQRERVLRPAAQGAFIGAFALTEAHAGSDASALRSRARRAGGDYVIDGEKVFITSGRLAGWAILFARMEGSTGKEGITCFLTPTDTPGYEVVKVEDKLGQEASDTCALRFDSLRVPEALRIGAEGEGYRIALSSLETGRIGIAAQSVGMAQAALEAAVAYARERTSFGRPLIEHQAVGFRLAEAKTRLEAARQMVLHAARMKDAGQPCLTEAAMAKLFASEAAERIVSDAIQTFGGYGYSRDFPVERIYRDVRVCQIYEGTSDIQKMLILRGMA
ncbi:acyl-CoA dehydrogenase [Rhodobacter sphaeroides]|jgi:Acyl-CoA dehydrogenases|uniref:3-sulfinopropanoyl-CoA desulfinase n=1 Tax=Cereibacter sphaeroides (strain ATCC 17023 / DSM 158 / JCM 6121 / CCUG 31486 / LMG 2827 / NBRC 12203 / NCIMB 8253 / ATH 2.4.1.) TaxID=272943 RepID=Q3IXD7_CERS4|nr:acyl-CoA dehydrogenase family protein [Cereibacter sphaeroides]ABA80797.1 Acyl-CoA dehydrogenase [Cereibacter sphaeroides 2.4.1]AMJ49122.1 acyl-CoA dehydrogenase [Cereibacter sphaeroides]ANS35839.1 acyl-CoA dehydrogenase [Cereibacter sphaeroides]ATN64892.1 acyl-CoA dehydrogenase [Cereibacter sphaeroides]AXC63086.1 acyl-CoA dehydrogenase [Cereibacter sphaeroides 2.4.1]